MKVLAKSFFMGFNLITNKNALAKYKGVGMNINVNEVLLQNKKIRFGEEPEAAKPAAIVTPESGENKPQTGLNSLMFQGLNNVVSNPQLAQELGVMNEDAPKTAETAQGYAIPYQSNIAFQGKAGKFKNIAMAALMGLMSLGAVSTLSSCDGDKITQEVTINMDEIMKMVNEMMELYKQMLEQQQITNDQLTQMNQYMLQLMEQVQKGFMSAEEFYEQMFNYMVINSTNQEIIIDQLVQNGKTQEEANKLIQELIEEVRSGNLTAQEALNKIQNLLGDIKGLLEEAIANFNKYYDQMLAKQDELIETSKSGFEELIKTGQISNEKLDKLSEQSATLISLSEQASKERQEIKEAIENGDFGSDANIQTIVDALNANKNDLINAIMKLGYTQAQVEKMTAAQIIAAIDKNTELTNSGNQLLAKISSQLDILPEIYQNGKITKEQLQEFYNMYIEAITNSGEYSEEMIAKLEELANKLDAIQGTLTEILEQLKTMSKNFNEFAVNFENDRKTEFDMLEDIIKGNQINTSILESMKNTQNNMAVNLDGIRTNTDALLNIAKDDTKFNELMEAIKNINAGSGSEGDITKADLEAMFKSLGITITEALDMSQTELIQAIQDFQKTYIETEQKQLEEMQTIQIKLDDLSIFNGLAKDEIVNAINNVTNAVNSGNEDITNELKALQTALNKLQQAVDALYKEVGEMSQKANTYYSQFASQFDKALGYLSSIDTNINKLYSAQLIANKYLDNFKSVLEEVKLSIKNIEVAIGEGGSGSGSGITLEQLEEIWQKHDEANYKKYKELLENMQINVDVNTDDIEALLAKIDNRLEQIQGNSEILDKIYNLLKDIDWTNPDYSAKLDRIIEILENFKCNCECGGNNEGIIGDLEDVLNG